MGNILENIGGLILYILSLFIAKERKVNYIINGEIGYKNE